MKPSVFQALQCILDNGRYSWNMNVMQTHRFLQPSAVTTVVTYWLTANFSVGYEGDYQRQMMMAEVHCCSQFSECGTGACVSGAELAHNLDQDNHWSNSRPQQQVELSCNKSRRWWHFRPTNCRTVLTSTPCRSHTLDGPEFKLEARANSTNRLWKHDSHSSRETNTWVEMVI